MNGCIVPISGGLDSTVLLHYAVKQAHHGDGYDEVYAISFNYGQRHKKELKFAQEQSKLLNVPLDAIDLTDLSKIADSSLTNTDTDVAKTRDVLGDAQTVNYVPFRNTIMLSICCAKAESVGASAVFHGAAQVDTQAGYWDGSREYMVALNGLVSLNRKNRIQVGSPLINKTKAEIIAWGVELGVDFSKTWTCYEGKKKACGECPACSSRIMGFMEAGIKDPVPYSIKIPWKKHLTTV